MPMPITASMRCQSKNLMAGAVPMGGGTPTDSVNVQLVAQGAASTGMAGSMTMTLPLTDDPFVVGGYYEVTLADGAAPPATQSEKQGAPQRTQGPHQR